MLWHRFVHLLFFHLIVIIILSELSCIRNNMNGDDGYTYVFNEKKNPVTVTY